MTSYPELQLCIGGVWKSAEGQPTLPSTMGVEKAANPFLRADVATVASAVGMAGAPAADVFAEIRTRKNRF